VAVVSRFAPAPTGFLHLGHVVNAIYVWGVARARGGRVLLRVEDHDFQRSRLEYERAILDDLAWLGFEADLSSGPLRQSERGSVYEDALSALRAAGLVYACECSRADILERSLQGPAAARSKTVVEEMRYAGTCGPKALAEQAGRGLRVRLAPSIERFVDLRHGPQEQRPSEQCGDLLIKDREGNWTYQFAVTVDDFVQGVTLVIRGDDLLPSTGRQIQLARLLGRDRPPHFLHHPLVMKTPTQKLSKSDQDTGIHELREQGWSPERVVGHAAWLAGLISAPEPLPARRVSSIM
jgi:glutamyl-tRNA synthetase/glutamyl-Q tRNA(Asp) synthetase